MFVLGVISNPVHEGHVDWQHPRAQAVLLKYSDDLAGAARYLGCSIPMVRRARSRLGWFGESPRIDWTKWDPYIGRMGDQDLARVMTDYLGRTIARSTVRSRRLRLNIYPAGVSAAPTRRAV